MKDTDEFIGLGAGGHAKVIIDTLRQRGEHIHGLLVPPDDIEDAELRVQILGSDEMLHQLYDEGFRKAFIGVGMHRSSRLRQRLQGKCEEIGFVVPPIVHPSAVLADSVRLDDGVQIMANATINAETHVKEGTIVNTGAVIEHDCDIGPFAHISPGSALAGDVTVGSSSHIGIGSTIIQETEVGDDVTVGAHSLVLDDVDSDQTVVGAPVETID